MCIICNAGVDAGTEALDHFASSRPAMRRATDAMLGARNATTDATAKAHYDRTHKAMVRLMREWNRLEESRESGHPPKDAL